MMCDPCFMDANQVGFVHELTWEEIQTMLDNAITIKPRRQMSVQFSGGEPTLSPYFLDAVRYAVRLDTTLYRRLRTALSSRRALSSRSRQPKLACVMHTLQFDGIGNAANAHRAVGNLFDVKLRPSTTCIAPASRSCRCGPIVNGINNEQVGRIIKFALDNRKRIGFLSCPASFVHWRDRGCHR